MNIQQKLFMYFISIYNVQNYKVCLIAILLIEIAGFRLDSGQTDQQV